MRINKDTMATLPVGWTWKSSGHFNTHDHLYSFLDKFFKFITWSTLTAIIKKVAFDNHDPFFFILFGIGFVYISSWVSQLLVNPLLNRVVIPPNFERSALIITGVLMMLLASIATLAVQNGFETVLDKITVLQKPK